MMEGEKKLFMSYKRGFPYGLHGKEGTCHEGDQGLILGGKEPLEEDMAPTPVFLPGESRGQGGLAGYSPRGHRAGLTLAVS